MTARKSDRWGDTRMYEDPTIERTPTDSVHDTIERHPSYAMIGASRVSGHTFLFGSDFSHQHYVTITISRSELHRGLSNDWPAPRGEMIEVALSESQWATFVSRMNVGSGVQCTLQHIDHERVPQIPEPTKRQHQFMTEANERLQLALDSLKSLRAQISAMKISDKAKKEVLWQVEVCERNFGGESFKFIADQFGEHIESVTEQAKIEVGAYIQSAITRAGVAALTDGRPPISLPEEKP